MTYTAANPAQDAPDAAHTPQLTELDVRKFLANLLADTEAVEAAMADAMYPGREAEPEQYVDSVTSYAEEGVMTLNEGLVIRFGDGTKALMTIHVK